MQFIHITVQYQKTVFNKYRKKGRQTEGVSIFTCPNYSGGCISEPN